MSVADHNQRRSDLERRLRRGVDKHLIAVLVGVVGLLSGLLIGGYSRGLLDLGWIDYLKLAALMFAVIGFERLVDLAMTMRAMKRAEAEAEASREELDNAASRAQRAFDRHADVSS